jgi:hypothetical protein
MTTTASTATETVQVAGLSALVTQVVDRLLGVSGVDPSAAVTAALKELGYGHCAYCRQSGGPDTLELINQGPSFGCRDLKACKHRLYEAELSSQLGTARNLVANLDQPLAVPALASTVTLIDHLLARLGVSGAELHPELED